MGEMNLKSEIIRWTLWLVAFVALIYATVWTVRLSWLLSLLRALANG
jgi:hypothetical protein